MAECMIDILSTQLQILDAAISQIVGQAHSQGLAFLDFEATPEVSIWHLFLSHREINEQVDRQIGKGCTVSQHPCLNL